MGGGGGREGGRCIVVFLYLMPRCQSLGTIYHGPTSSDHLTHNLKAI